jgi:GDPmannose 4,6-dehydratase
MNVAVISGVTGQDGSYLAELLLSKGYFVIGFSRRVSVDTTERIKHLLTNPNFQFEEGDVCDQAYIGNLLQKYRVGEFYNLAAQSHVSTSFKQPHATTEINYFGLLNILSCIKTISPGLTKLYQASTSEMFGKNYDEKNTGLSLLCCPPKPQTEKYQNEDTKFSPQSPYAIAKLAAHHACRLYRESYGLDVSCGILFNHESPRRGEKFVTRKITKWIGEFIRWINRIDSQLIDVSSDENDILKISSEDLGGDGRVTDTFPKLRLGNLDAYRDWGHAKDYVRAMWLMLQQDKADDYVIATGKTHSIREFLAIAFTKAGLSNWEDCVVVDPKFYRPAEVDYLLGDPLKAKGALGWEPDYSFDHLVAEMVGVDL